MAVSGGNGVGIWRCFLSRVSKADLALPRAEHPSRGHSTGRFTGTWSGPAGQCIPGAWPPRSGGARGSGGQWGHRPAVTPSGGRLQLEGPEVFCVLWGIIGLNKVTFFSEGLLRAFAVRGKMEDNVCSVSQTYLITESISPEHPRTRRPWNSL